MRQGKRQVRGRFFEKKRRKKLLRTLGLGRANGNAPRGLKKIFAAFF